MQTAFDTYSASQMFGFAASDAQELQEVLDNLRNIMDKPELRSMALDLAVAMAQRLESVCTDAALAYDPDGLPGGATGFLRKLGRN